MDARPRLSSWIWGLGLASALLLGCEGKLTNTATVYPPVSGLVEVRWRLTTDGVRQVVYAVDGRVLGSSSSVETRFAVQLDTLKLPNGVHTITVSARDAAGLVLRVVQHTVIVAN